jgi:hypothetical protein
LGFASKVMDCIELGFMKSGDCFCMNIQYIKVKFYLKYAKGGDFFLSNKTWYVVGFTFYVSKLAS